MIASLRVKLLEISNWELVLTMCIIKVSVSFGLQYISQSYFEEEDFINTSLEGLEIGEIFLLTVIIGPLIETFLFQFLIIELVLLSFRKIKIRGGEFLAVLLSSILFATTHPFSFIYLFSAFISGIIYGIFYLIAKNRMGLNGFLVVFIVHSFYNLIVFFMNEFL